jgi:spore germination protein GerM
MNKKFFTGILLFSLIFTFAGCSFVIPITPTDESIKVSTPAPNSDVASPLKITGDARGTWFFEASFPVKLLDANNKILAQGVAQAKGDWMTENFVPFETSLEFVKPTTNTGTLVLSKDNPSGLPENDKSVSIPIKFSTETTPTEETMTVKVFFSNTKFDPNIQDCNKTYPVDRVIPKTKAVARAAVETLLKGISMAEEEEGYSDQINAGVKIQSLEIKNGIAYIDFNQALQEKVGGSCRIGIIISQITNTLKQFSSIKDVVISVNGDSETSLQP